jgi:hypothetical protein
MTDPSVEDASEFVIASYSADRKELVQISSNGAVSNGGY